MSVTTYGPSNDAPPEVQIEIRAAELAATSLAMQFPRDFSDEEWCGYTRGWLLLREEVPGQQSGWLARHIEREEVA